MSVGSPGEDGAAAVESALRAACRTAAVPRPVAGFELYRIPPEHPFLRSLALPRDEAVDWSAALAELREECIGHGLVPRIELLAERRGRLRAALAAAGFLRTLAVPVLVARPAPMAGNGTIARLAAESRQELLAATLDAQHAILGAAPPSPAERAAFRACLERGSVRTWVRLDEAGRPIAGASLLGAPPVVELAGLWTLPEHRRRGFGRGVAEAALGGAYAAGCRLVWAGAASTASLAVLRGLAMTPVGTLESWEKLG